MFKQSYKKLGLALLLVAVMALTFTGLLALGTSAEEEPTYTVTVNVTDSVEGAKVYLAIGEEQPVEVVSGQSYSLVRGTQYTLSTNVESITGYDTAWTNAAGAPTTNLSGQIGRNMVYNVAFLPETYTIHYVGSEHYDFANGIASTHTYNSETAIINPVRDGYDLIGWTCYDHEPTEGDTTGRTLAASPTLGKQDYTTDIWLEPIWQGKLYCVIRLDCVFQPGQVYNLGDFLGYEILTDYRMGDVVLGSGGPESSYRGYSYHDTYDYASDSITVTISYEASEIEALRERIDKVIENPDVAGYNVVFRYYLPKEYTVTTDFAAGDDTVTLPDGKTMPEKHVFNQNTALPTVSRVGYTFNGWLLTVEGAQGEELLAPGVSIEAEKYDGNITLKASWTPKQYDVIYDWNGHDEADDAAIAAQNQTLLEKYGKYTYDTPVSFPYPSRTGYTFLGWIVSVEGNALFEGAICKDLPAEMFSMEDPRAVTLTAQWQANSYTVTLNGNGATEGVYPESFTVTFDQALAVEGLTIPKRFGYIFLGYWSTDAQGAFLKAYIDGEGKSVCDAWDIPADTTLSAKWEKLPEVVPPAFKVNYLTETIEVEGGIPEGHYVFTLDDKVLDVTVDAEGKITVNRTVVTQISIPDSFFGETVSLLVWGDGIATSNYEGRITLAARPAAPVINKEILDIKPDYTTIEIVMAELLPYGYEFAISRNPEASIDSLVWQSSPRFENLYQGTVYYVYVRVNEDVNHPHGIAGVWKYETYYVNYLEERIERMQDLKQEGDGEQVDAVIKAAIQQAREMMPSPTFYEDLEKLYQNTVNAVAFARLQDQHIAELRKLCEDLIATELYSEAGENTIRSLCENAVSVIVSTNKSDEVRGTYESARDAMYAIRISNLTSGDMEMTAQDGLPRSLRLSMIFLSDFSALSEQVNSAIRAGHLLYTGTATTYSELCDALLTKYVVSAYTMGLYEGDALYTDFDGLYEFRLLLDESLQNVQGLMVGYYDERTGQLQILDAAREGNCLVFTTDRVADFVILGDPVVEMQGVIAALSVILLCQLVAVVLLLVRRVKTAKEKKAQTSYAFLPTVALTVRLLPANALTTVALLGALVILLQIVLIYLLLSSDLVRRARPSKEEEREPAPASPEVETAEETAAAALAYAYAEEATETAEDELSEADYETDPNNFAEEGAFSDAEIPEEAEEADPFAVYDVEEGAPAAEGEAYAPLYEDEEIVDEETLPTDEASACPFAVVGEELSDPAYGVDVDGEVFADPAYGAEEDEGELAHPAYISEGEEGAIALPDGEVAYEGEDFIEPAANPRYSLPDEEFSTEESFTEEISVEEIPVEEIPVEEIPAEDTVWEDFAEEPVEELWSEPADEEKK